MAREINLTSQEWCNIIFEGKNKEYGAYEIRNNSSKRHLIAYVVVAVFALFAFSIPRLTHMFGVQTDSTEANGSVKLSIIDMSKPKVPDENIQKVYQAPEPEVKLKNSIKFTTPKIEPDEKVKEEDELKGQEELMRNKDVISVATVKDGSEDGINIKELEGNKLIVADNTVDESVKEIVEIMPTFPGGETELLKYLKEHIVYPVVAAEVGVQGKVTVQFVVGKDGSIENVHIARGVDKSLDAEAVRVIKSMPKWIPGKQDGRAVRVKFTVPVNFQLK
ncbi:MAG: energy transducer TonB [Paludibacteraceae bacterium]